MTPLCVLKPPRPARKRVHPGTCEVSQTNTISGVVRILHFRDSSKISDELSMAPCVVWRRQSPTEMQFSAGSAKLMKINNPCGAWPQEQLVNLKIQGRTRMCSQHWCPVGLDQSRKKFQTMNPSLPRSERKRQWRRTINTQWHRYKHITRYAVLL